MMRKLNRLLRNERGAGITEFALLAPAFIGMIITIGQFGILYFAQSGLKSAVAEGARYASIYPRPTNEAILSKISGTRFGMDPANIVSTEVTDCVESGRACVDIKMKYTVPMDLVPISWPSQLLTEERRVFVAALPTEGDGTGSGGGGGGSGGDDDGKGGGKGGGKDGDTGGETGGGTGGGTEEPDCKGKKCEPGEPSDPVPSDPTPDDPTDPEPEPCKNAKKCEGTEPTPTNPTPTNPKPTEPTPTNPTPTTPTPCTHPKGKC